MRKNPVWPLSKEEKKENPVWARPSFSKESWTAWCMSFHHHYNYKTDKPSLPLFSSLALQLHIIIIIQRLAQSLFHPSLWLDGFSLSSKSSPSKTAQRYTHIDRYMFLFLWFVFIFWLTDGWFFFSDLCKRPVDGFSAGLVDDSNIYEWSVTIIGPPDTL